MVKDFNVSVNMHGIISPSKEWDFPDKAKSNSILYSEMHLKDKLFEKVKNKSMPKNFLGTFKEKEKKWTILLSK